MMTRLSLTAVSTALILAGAAQAQPGPRGSGEERSGMRALMMLGAADYDGDNTVTRAEVRRLQAEEFAYRDRNGDGYVDLADASPTRQRLAAMRPDGDAEARPGRRHGRQDRMERLDADADGRISRAEFVDGEMRSFDRLDANGDDAVSPDEIDAALESRRGRRAENREAMQWWRD